ncbi:MAG: tetratricopeptide repeat protein [bacterium]
MNLYSAILLFFFFFFVGILLGHYIGAKNNNKTSFTSVDDKSAYIRGLQYIISHEPDKAIAEFTKAVQINSGTVEIYLNLGNLFREKGEVERALRIHQSILLRPSLSPRIKSSALMELGRDYSIAGFIDRAISVFKNITKLHPDKLDAYKELVNLYEEEKNWEKAFTTAKYIEKISKKNQSVTISHIICEQAKEKLAEKQIHNAIKDLKRAMSLNPSCIEAYLVLGDIYFNESQLDQAISTWQRVIHLDLPFSHLVYKKLEKAYLNKGNYDQIEQVYHSYLRKHTGDISTRLILADYYQKKGAINKAIQILKDGLKINPHATRLSCALGEILIKEDREKEIIEEYKLLLNRIERKKQIYVCNKCGYKNNDIIWKCPQCKEWDTFTLKS